jgi:hypothetical protein
MSSSSSAVAEGFVEDTFAFDQLPPAPAPLRRIDPQLARNEAAAMIAARRP